MTSGISAIFMILLLIIMAATLNAQAQFAPGSQADRTSTQIAYSEIPAINIIGIDSIAFPKIKLNIFINKFCALAGSLKKEDFKVEENSYGVSIDNLYFTGNASGQKLDLAVIFDDTGSMGEEISAMKSKVEDLTDTFKASGIDANYSLISFKDTISVKAKWTNDPDIFRKQISSLKAYGGDDEPEVLLDAIEAVISMGFRPDAHKVILVITDAHAHYKNDGSEFSNYTKEEVGKDLKEAGVIFIPITPTFEKPTNYVDLRQIANDIQSMRIDINSADFSIILEQFKGMLTGTYVVEYTSPEQKPSENKTVLISVNVPGCVIGSASSSYITPGSAIGPNNPPAVNSLTSDITSPQDSGSIITWTTNATDPDGDPVFYRYLQNDEPVSDWTSDNMWTWTATDAGSYRIEVQVRDGKHAGQNGWDDRRVASFTIAEQEPAELMNQLPVINDLVAAQDKGMDITWMANATDQDGDQVLYRFFLNNKSMTDWTTDNKWTLNAADGNVGDNQVEAQARDGRHGGPDSYDDAKSVQFELSSMKLMVQTWEKTFGGPGNDEALSVQQTRDGGYIVAGMVETGTNDGWLIKSSNKGNIIRDSGILTGHPSSDKVDVWLIKTDANGNNLWDKAFGGSQDDIGYSVQQTNDEGYIVAGMTESYGSGKNDAWLIKTDANGNKLWDKTFGGSQNDVFYSVQQTSDGGYIGTGSTYIIPEGSYGTFYPDVWLIKTDSQGNKVWEKTFGSSNSDIGYSVQQTSDGGYVVAGIWSEVAGGVEGSVWLSKTDSLGNEEWDRTFEGSSSWEWAKSVQQTSDGGYIVLCRTHDENGYKLIKTDAYGKRIWDKSLKGRAVEQDRLVRQTLDGGYIVTGVGENSDGSNCAFLIKMDSLGSEEWNKTFSRGGNNWGNSVQQTGDRGYILAGTGYIKAGATKPDNSETGIDVWLLKTDANGNV